MVGWDGRFRVVGEVIWWVTLGWGPVKVVAPLGSDDRGRMNWD